MVRSSVPAPVVDCRCALTSAPDMPDSWIIGQSTPLPVKAVSNVGVLAGSKGLVSKQVR
jgi:hypothetical protein